MQNEQIIGKLAYRNFDFVEADIVIYDNQEATIIKIESKISLLNANSYKDFKIPVAEIQYSISNALSIHFIDENKKYSFKKTGLWKIRFILTDDKNEEIIALVPTISWSKKTHEYALQLNEELIDEINPLLILHTLHCANCSLSMINGNVRSTTYFL